MADRAPSRVKAERLARLKEREAGVVGLWTCGEGERPADHRRLWNSELGIWTRCQAQRGAVAGFLAVVEMFTLASL